MHPTHIIKKAENGEIVEVWLTILVNAFFRPTTEGNSWDLIKKWAKENCLMVSREERWHHGKDDTIVIFSSSKYCRSL